MRNALHSISNVMNKIEVSDLILVTRLIFLGMKVIVAWKCWLENINCHFISTLKTISLQSRSYLLTCENQNKTIYYLKMFRIVFCQKNINFLPYGHLCCNHNKIRDLKCKNNQLLQHPWMGVGGSIRSLALNFFP